MIGDESEGGDCDEVICSFSTELGRKIADVSGDSHESCSSGYLF